MQRTFITALLIALLTLAARAQAPQDATQSGDESQAPPPTPFEVAQDLAARGRLDKALAQLDQLAAQTPEPAGVERLRGMILYQKEQFPAAIEAFTRAGAQDPSDRESIEMHGVSLFRLGRSPDALPFLERAHAAVERANIDPQYVLGLCYADVQRYDDARHAFAAQYGFAPDSAEAYLLAGRLFLRREFAAEAAVQARKSLEINPALPLAHQLLGEVALARGDLPGAIYELEAERKLNPLNGALYDRLGDAYLRNEQYAEAQQALNRAVLLEPSSTAPYILLGQTFLKLKQPIQALHYLDRAVKMDPANYITHNLLGQAYKATGQMAEANREFQQGVALQHSQSPQAAGK
jgi:predicted Zn-dependent protease